MGNSLRDVRFVGVLAGVLIGTLAVLGILIGTMKAPENPGSPTAPTHESPGILAEEKKSVIEPKPDENLRSRVIPFESVGRRERLQEIKVVQIKGTHTVGRETRNFVETWQGVNRIKVDQTPKGGLRDLRGFKGGPGYLTVLLVGNHAWASLGRNQRQLDGDGLGFYQNYHYGTTLSNLIVLQEGGFDFVPAGDHKARGKDCFAVIVKRAGKGDLKMFFDKQTKLLFKAEFKGKFFDQNLVFQRNETLVEFFFSDYKVVDGINHWHVREQWRNGQMFSELVLSEVRFLTKKDDSLFYFPAFDAEVKQILAATE